MAYATIEEAWGLKSFARESSSRPEKRVVIKTPPIKRPPAFESSTPHRPVPTVRDVQKFIAGLYAKSGASGVIQLLGPQISKALCGKAADAKSWLSSLLEDPEKMLMILAVLFGVIVLLDVTKPVEPSLAPW
jgi:hypothetical protein